MKKSLYIPALAGVLALSSVSLASCSDDDEVYDFPGDPYNRVYAPDCSGTFKMVQTPAGAFGSLDCSIPAMCNRTAAGDITVNIAPDFTLVDAYNEENGTSYLPMPQNAFTIENGSLVIPAGEMTSVEQTKIALVEDQDILSGLNDSKGYILPLRITSLNGGGATLANSVKSISYLTMTVTEDAVNHDGTLADSKGTPVADRSAWKVTSPTGADCSNYAAFFDGDAGNYTSISSDDDMELIIDMGKTYSFDAIEANYNYYGYYEYGSLPQNAVISLSTDGSTWRSVATVEAPSQWSLPKYILFWGMMEARYIKLAIPATESWYGKSASFECGNFNVYAK